VCGVRVRVCVTCARRRGASNMGFSVVSASKRQIEGECWQLATRYTRRTCQQLFQQTSFSGTPTEVFCSQNATISPPYYTAKTAPTRTGQVPVEYAFFPRPMSFNPAHVQLRGSSFLYQNGHKESNTVNDNQTVITGQQKVSSIMGSMGDIPRVTWDTV